MIKFTSSQQNVINNKNSNLLVSAAAGSGKTAVLVEKIIRIVVEEKIDITNLLVVTFTRASASEMKDRIKKALEEKIKENNDEYLKKQMLLLNEAQITTIDAFCKSVISSNIHLLDFDISFRVVDTQENEILKNETIDDLFSELYENEDKSFLNLLSSYGNKRLDFDLKKLIIDINDFSNQNPFSKKWLIESKEFFNVEDKDDLFYLKNYFFDVFNDAKNKFIYIINLIKESLNVLEEFKELYTFYENYTFFLKNLENLNENINIFLNDLSKENLEKIDIKNLNLDENKKSFRISKNLDPLIKEIYKNEKEKLDSLKKSTEEEIKNLYINICDIKKENEIIYPYVRDLCDITLLFKEKYQKKKKELNLVDFSDIEHLALKILSKEDENKKIIPSDVAKEYMKKYKEIFIDEYQDSNSLQETILSLIARKSPKNRFMVGDVKQSIYRFRQADPSIFMEKYKTYDDFENKNSFNKKIMLYENFRSRKEILECVNYIFKKIMNKETAELDYTDKEKLNPKATFKEDENNKISKCVEIHLVTDEKNDTEDIEENLQEDIEIIKNFKLEAIEIANIIYKIKNNKDFKILDKDEYRNVEYKDIVILMRSPSTNAKILEEILFKYNIPSFIETKGGYFESYEVDLIINLLKVIDNPIDDIPFLSVMKSFIYNFTTKELAKIRLIDKELHFYNICKKILEDENIKIDVILKEKIKKLMDDLKLFSKKETLISTDELIWFIYKNLGILEYFSLLENGNVRKTNLYLLFEKAKEFEKTSYKGLFNFINYIEKIKINSNASQTKPSLENENSITLMSIHKSKGLEFPVVILANTDKKFNFKQSNEKVSLHQKLGIAPMIYDVSKKIYFPSLMKKRIDTLSKKEQIAEEMRLLYVAMTRAKEKLIITGNIKTFEILDKFKDKKITNFEILNGKNFLEWILMSISNLKEKDFVNLSTKEISRLLKSNDTEISISLKQKEKILKEKETIENEVSKNYPKIEIKKEKNEKTKFKDILKRRFKEEYKFLNSTKKPSSISVSEIKKIVENEREHNFDYYKEIFLIEKSTPNFIKKETKKITKQEKGSIMHLVMELLDFKKFEIENLDDKKNRKIIKDFLNELNEKNILLKEEIETVNIEKIINFLKTDLFKEIYTADKNKKLHKEKAINYNINLSEIYKNEQIQENEKTMLVGIIDIFYETKDGFVLIDYKTDFVTKENINEIKEKYKIQLDLYKAAIERISGKKVIKKGLYLFGIDKFIEI